MSKILRVSIISLSLALIICISDGIINFHSSLNIRYNQLIEIVLFTQVLGVGLFFFLRTIDLLILDKLNINSNKMRIISYMIASVLFIAIFVTLFSSIYINGLPVDIQEKKVYISQKRIMAYVAGYLYLGYGITLFLISEWIINKNRLKRFLNREG